MWVPLELSQYILSFSETFTRTTKNSVSLASKRNPGAQTTTMSKVLAKGHCAVTANKGMCSRMGEASTRDSLMSVASNQHTGTHGATQHWGIYARLRDFCWPENAMEHNGTTQKWVKKVFRSCVCTACQQKWGVKWGNIGKNSSDPVSSEWCPAESTR